MNVEDLGDLQKALLEAEEIKKDRFKYQNLGKNKTLMMVFSTIHCAHAFPPKRQQ